MPRSRRIHTPPADPIFKKYPIGRLWRRTGYSMRYLAAVFDGSLPITQDFRARCIQCLERPEEELFLPTPAADAAKEAKA